MATHYARETGIPACGFAVETQVVDRTTKWRSAPVSVTTKKTTAQVVTAGTRVQVDCGSCTAFMDADGLP